MASGKRRRLARREYRPGVELSVIGMGGIVVIGMSPDEAGRVVAESVERGVNYFDVGPSYGNGEAEEKLGPALEPYREGVFLACKTLRRDAAGVREELSRSLERLRTDRFDLYQHHGVSKPEEVDAIFAPGGAMEAFVEAREKGLVRFLGFSAHHEEAAVRMLERFPFDSVLFPVNYVCWAQGGFGSRLLAEAKRRGAARLALKAIAKAKRSPGGSKKHGKCWYEPFGPGPAARARAALALRFTLSEDVTATVPPGDEELYRMCLDLAAEFTPLSAAERSGLLRSSAGLEPIFRAPSP